MTLQKIRTRRGTAAQWSGINPVLGLGEKGIETDTLFEKVGDGATAWNGLPYLDSGSFILRSTFVARVAGGWAPEVGFEVSAAGLAYVYTGAGTNISDLPGWVPAGDMSLYHWGVTGWENHFSRHMATKLAGDDGAVDDTARIQAAMNYAALTGRQLLGDLGRVFGVSAPLFFGSENSPRTVKEGAKIANMNICVIGGDWSAVGGDRQFVLTIGNRTLNVSAKFNVNSAHIKVDGNRIAKGGIIYLGTTWARHEFNSVIHCSEVLQQAGNALVRGDSRSNDCTRTIFHGCTGAQWLESDPEFGDAANYTADGLVIRGADSRFEMCIFSGCKNCGVFREASQTMLIGCHFWNGAVTTLVQGYYSFVVDEAIQATFTGCRFDQGAFYVNCGRDGTPANFVLSGSTMQSVSSADKYIIFHTETADTSLSGVTIVGNRINGAQVEFRTTGSGSFVSPIDLTLSGNSRPGSSENFRAGAFVEVYGGTGAGVKRSGAFGGKAFHTQQAIIFGFNAGTTETGNPDDQETGIRNHGGIGRYNSSAAQLEFSGRKPDGAGWSFDYDNSFLFDEATQSWWAKGDIRHRNVTHYGASDEVKYRVFHLSVFTATTGTVTFNFTFTGSNIETASVWINMTCNSINATDADHAKGGWEFLIGKTAGGVTSQRAKATFGLMNTFDVDDAVFANVGAGVFTITVANPTGQALLATGDVKMTCRSGRLSLTSVVPA